jgi:hypothetical protein
MKKEKSNFAIEMEFNRLYLRHETFNSISARIDVTDLYHFLKEFFLRDLSADKDFDRGWNECAKFYKYHNKKKQKQNEEKNGKNVIWTERAKYKTECPYCGNESDFCEDEDEAFKELTRILDNGDTVCDECDKKLSFGCNN